MASKADPAARLAEFWRDFSNIAGPREAEFTVLGFGDSRALADELVQSVLAGAKRATASLLHDFMSLGLPLPRPGDFGIIVDGNRTPRCIVRIVLVEVKAMGEVDAQFALDEGGGDCSLGWWMKAHLRFFDRQGSQDGFTVDRHTQVVLERFEVVWPPEIADQPKRT